MFVCLYFADISLTLKQNIKTVVIVISVESMRRCKWHCCDKSLKYLKMRCRVFKFLGGLACDFLPKTKTQYCLLLTTTVSMSPLREDCKSFSSYSSLLFELDIPLFTHRIILSSLSFHNCCFKRKFAFKGRKCTQFFSHSPLQNCPVSLQKVLVPKPFLCYSPVLDGRTQNVIQYGVVAIICGFKTADFVSLFAAKDDDSWRKRKRSRKGENLIFFSCFSCV